MDAEGATREALACVHEVERTVKDFARGDDDVLAERINAFVASLNQVRSTCAEVDVQIPLDLLRRVDAGANPNRFVVDAFHSCVIENQKVKGKATQLAAFKKALLEEASAAFPEEAKAFLRLKQRDGGAGGT